VGDLVVSIASSLVSLAAIMGDRLTRARLTRSARVAAKGGQSTTQVLKT
jgi:hypothetical protein